MCPQNSQNCRIAPELPRIAQNCQNCPELMKKKLEHTKKQFFKDMTISDLAEIDNLRANSEINKFELISDQPATLSDQDVFRIEYIYTNPVRLKVRGIRYGLICNNDVYRVYYEAAAQHYYEKYLPDFNQFVGTFKLSSKRGPQQKNTKTP